MAGARTFESDGFVDFLTLTRKGACQVSVGMIEGWVGEPRDIEENHNDDHDNNHHYIFTVTNMSTVLFILMLMLLVVMMIMMAIIIRQSQRWLGEGLGRKLSPCRRAHRTMSWGLPRWKGESSPHKKR